MTSKRIGIPRIGDLWEFHPTTGARHRTKKRIAEIYWRLSSDGKDHPWIKWEHTPKARYIGDCRVKFFLAKKAIRLIARLEEQKVFGKIKTVRS